MAAAAVALLALYSILIGLIHARHHAESVTVVTSSWSQSQTYVFLVLVGLTLLALSTRLSRGLRAAAWIAVAGAASLASVSMLDGNHLVVAMAVVVVCVLVSARGAFTVDLEDAPPWAVLVGAGVAWVLLYAMLLAEPSHGVSRSVSWLWDLISDAGVYIGASGIWHLVVEVALGCVAAMSVVAVRIVLRPRVVANVHDEHEHQVARAILEERGTDSLAPFLLRPDKALLFEQDAVLAYQVLGDAAIVSGDPVGPDSTVSVLASRMLETARYHGWHVVFWAASERYLDLYHSLGMHAVHAGDEAIVDPARFTLQGRGPRKLRQSVHRVERRGWAVTVREGRTLDADLEREIKALERRWRQSRRRILGFAMSMGAFDPDIGPDDVYTLGRAPDGELRAVMRFAAHCGKLSLDSMRRVGDTPNGLNEALVCATLGFARERGVPEVSLNYAGLAHLVRARGPAAGRPAPAVRLVLRLLGRRFQMERLVLFDEKFSPVWRPRYLVYESRLRLPLVVLRVLQAEGYLSLSRRPQMRSSSPSGAGASAPPGAGHMTWPAP